MFELLICYPIFEGGEASSSSESVLKPEPGSEVLPSRILRPAPLPRFGTALATRTETVLYPYMSALAWKVRNLTPTKIHIRDPFYDWLCWHTPSMPEDRVSPHGRHNLMELTNQIVTSELHYLRDKTIAEETWSNRGGVYWIRTRKTLKISHYTWEVVEAS